MEKNPALLRMWPKDSRSFFDMCARIIDFLSFGFLVLPQTETTWLSHLPRCNQQDLKIHSKPWFKRNFEVILNCFVKLKGADPKSGSFSDFLLPLRGFPFWLWAPARFARITQSMGDSSGEQDWASLPAAQPEQRPHHWAALPAPLWQRFLHFFLPQFYRMEVL